MLLISAQLRSTSAKVERSSAEIERSLPTLRAVFLIYESFCRIASVGADLRTSAEIGCSSATFDCFISILHALVLKLVRSTPKLNAKRCSLFHEVLLDDIPSNS